MIGSAWAVPKEGSLSRSGLGVVGWGGPGVVPCGKEEGNEARLTRSAPGDPGSGSCFQRDRLFFRGLGALPGDGPLVAGSPRGGARYWPL